MAKHRIVLIEDSESDVWLLRTCLESVATNYELIVLKDGEATLQFIKKEREDLEQRPCVIVLDLHLPDYDGLEILQEIRRAPTLEHVNALIVSAMPSPETLQLIGKLGVPYTEKPQTLAGFEALANKIWDFCQSHFGAVTPFVALH
jgi:CheY-like chemotaxis protein